LTEAEKEDEKQIYYETDRLGRKRLKTTPIIRDKKYVLPKLPMPKDIEQLKPLEIYAMGREHGEQRVVDMLGFSEQFAKLKRNFWAALAISYIVLVGVILYFAFQMSLIPFYWVPRQVPLMDLVTTIIIGIGG
jgi:hypothetical protein